MTAEAAPVAPENNVLYRMWDGAGDLLYVGITLSIEARMRSHRDGKPWWPEVANISLQHFHSRDAVEAAEIKAIRTEQPRYNVVRYRTPDREATQVSKLESATPKIRIDSNLWGAFRVVTSAESRSRPGKINEFVGWYLGYHGHYSLVRPNATGLRYFGVKRARPPGQVSTWYMPNFDVERWACFIEATSEQGHTPTVVVDQFMRWYLREPNACCPTNPSGGTRYRD